MGRGGYESNKKMYKRKSVEFIAEKCPGWKTANEIQDKDKIRMLKLHARMIFDQISHDTGFENYFNKRWSYYHSFGALSLASFLLFIVYFGWCLISAFYYHTIFWPFPIFFTSLFIVLCLGLLHHLVLGSGMSLADVLGIFSELTKKTLVLEYVDLQDKLIQGEPSFFKNIGKYSANTYNIEAVIEETKKCFNSCEVLDSHPLTRRLLICRK